MSELIERCVARLDNRADRMMNGIEDMTPEEIVRCVIEGMREPTEAMVEAVANGPISPTPTGDQVRKAATDFWQAMLGAALARSTPPPLWCSGDGR